MITTDIERAARAIWQGGLVAIPTETVYGLAADATNPDAVRRIYEIKGRPADHPLIVHLADSTEFATYAEHPSPAATRLAAVAWPGPLTLIVGRPASITPVATGDRDSVGLRVPANPIARRVIEIAGVPVAAPSANRFGQVSPTTAEHVLEDLGDVLDPERDLVLDGGPSLIGVESTIVDCTVDPPELLRTGGVSREELTVLLDGVADVAAATGPARASGMLPSHYAPRCEVRCVDTADDAAALVAGTPGSEILDLSTDVVAYAARLYDELRSADRRGVRTLIAVLPPPEGLGHAVRDRLTKAAAPRPQS